MAKFKKGDKVKTKKLRIGGFYDGLIFLRSMILYEGTIRNENAGEGSLMVEENPYYYRECMLTKIK